MDQQSNQLELYARPVVGVGSAIRHIYSFWSGIEQPVERVLLPNFQASIIFNFGRPHTIRIGSNQNSAFTLNRVAIVGPIKQAIRFQSEAGADMLSVNFSFDGFYRFFNIPVQELNGHVIHPDDLLVKKCFSLLWEQLMEAANYRDRVAIVDKFAGPYLKTGDNTLNHVAELIALCQKQLHLNPVKLMAKEQRVSERTAQLRFQKYVGFSPKEFARFVRFQRVLNELQTTARSQPDWYDFVERNGYYDQSHLIHDFAHFVGQSPTHLLHELGNERLYCAPYALP
jgi:AraC-like DNA-binding protein